MDITFIPVDKAGQIREGDRLLLRSAEGIHTETAKLVIRPGNDSESGGEEVVIRMGKNHYFITNMMINGESWVKQVFIVHRPPIDNKTVQS